MKTICSHCGQHFDVDEEYLGNSVECSSCGQQFVIQTIPENMPTVPLPQSENSGSSEDFIAPQSSENRGLRALTCEMCGSTELIKQNGVFVCQACGTKYSLEEAKKMMVEGTVNVSGTVKIDMSEKLKRLYTIARRAKDENNSDNAAKYYDMILQEDPESWEASFYTVYYQAMSCKIAEITSAALSVKNCLKNVVDLISQIQDKKARSNAYKEIATRSINIATMLHNAAYSYFDKIDSQIKDQFVEDYFSNIFSSAQICYELSDLFFAMKETGALSCTLMKTAIDLHKWCIAYAVDKSHHKATLKYYAEKIRIFEPNYKLPKIPSAGCYIATSVYGSYDCPEVWSLRRFRDNYLRKHVLGVLFIKSYYAISPSLVKYFGKNRIFVLFWRFILDRIVGFLNKRGLSTSKPYIDDIL